MIEKNDYFAHYILQWHCQAGVWPNHSLSVLFLRGIFSCYIPFYKVEISECKFGVFSYAHLCVCVCVCVCVKYTYSTFALCNIRWQCNGELLAIFHLNRVNSCFNLYELLKSILCWGFTPSDFFCLINSSSYSCTLYIYPL